MLGRHDLHQQRDLEPVVGDLVRSIQETIAVNAGVGLRPVGLERRRSMARLAYEQVYDSELPAEQVVWDAVDVVDAALRAEQAETPAI